MKRYYVGIYRCGNTTKREVFLFDKPDFTTHGHLYKALIGPFITKRGANFMAKYGINNPNLQTVADAERLSKIADNVRHTLLQYSHNNKIKRIQCDCGRWFNSSNNGVLQCSICYEER